MQGGMSLQQVSFGLKMTAERKKYFGLAHFLECLGKIAT